MAECECLAKCPFFNDKMANRPATAMLMKKQYCLGDNKNCARHMIFRTIGGQFVPADLFPGETARVPGVIAANKKG